MVLKNKDSASKNDEIRSKNHGEIHGTKNSWRPFHYWIKQRLDEKKISEENIGNYHHDLLRASIGAHIEVYYLLRKQFRYIFLILY